MVHSSTSSNKFEPENGSTLTSASSLFSVTGGTKWCLTVKNTFLSVETIGDHLEETQLYSKSAPAACSGFELLQKHVSKKADVEPSRLGVDGDLSENLLEDLNQATTTTSSFATPSSSTSSSASCSSSSSTSSSSSPSESSPTRSGNQKKPTTFDNYSSVLLNALNQDPRTTLMVKNIPNKYTQQMLLETLGNYRGQFDFFYLPIDFKNRCNVGYAFINFIRPEYIVPFVQQFEGHTWEKFNSQKVCNITYARIQGKHGMIEHFRNSRLLIEDKTCRPLIFQSDGPFAGSEEEFPIGPNYPHAKPVGSSGSPGWSVFHQPESLNCLVECSY